MKSQMQWSPLIFFGPKAVMYKSLGGLRLPDYNPMKERPIQ